MAAGPIFILPIIKYWLKDTNMVEGVQVVEGTAVQTKQAVTETPIDEKS